MPDAPVNIQLSVCLAWQTAAADTHKILFRQNQRAGFERL
jgi:hypothetical protein